MVGDSLNCGEAEAIYRTMKPQLLQDLNESGSVQSTPPNPGAAEQVTRPRPSVKPRPQAAESGDTVPAKGFAPQPPAFAEPIPPPTPPPTPRPPPMPATMEATAPWDPADSTEDKVPAWLAERLALDAEEQQRTERSRLWTRRLVGWGAAGVLLALVASGGLYLYDQSQVEGALVVVANTNPAPASAAPRLETAQASRALPASVVAPVTPAPAPAAPVSAEGSTAEGRAAVGGSAVARTDAGAGQPAPESSATSSATPPAGSVAQAGQAEDQPADIAPPPKRQRSHARKRVKAEASAMAGGAEPSARQRREETLMQCRAHGYDERQCLRRGCEMTRYGFACKG